ncbi:MAG: hypothetical protein LBT26_06570 [Clostridiales Family XIII bacterium]|nr:hypothetical protein [Clostridiales Family XIII bacterium]
MVTIIRRARLEMCANMKQKIITIIFTGDEIDDFNRLVEMSGIHGAQDTIKNIIHEYLKDK